jgi:hypothetical protein
MNLDQSCRRTCAGQKHRNRHKSRQGRRFYINNFCNDWSSQQRFIAERFFLIQDFWALQENLWVRHTNNWFSQSRQARKEKSINP